MKQADRFRESLTALRQSTATGVRVRQLILERTGLKPNDVVTLKNEIYEILILQGFVDEEIEALDVFEKDNEHPS